MHYISLRQILIRNEAGTHDQIVPANAPTLVIPKLYDAANAAGCVPCDEQGTIKATGAAAPVSPAPVVGTGNLEEPEPKAPVVGYTQQDVVDAVEAVIANNNKSDFGVTGRPKVAPVAKYLGHKPTAEELEAAWESVEAG